MTTDAGTPSDPLAIMSPIDALRRVAKLVKTTQPTWSNHLTTVCDAYEAAQAELEDRRSRDVEKQQAFFAAQSQIRALLKLADNRLADYTKVRNECDALREDAERYAMLFRDTWIDHHGVAIFRYIRSHDDFDRLGIEEANKHLDAARKAK